MKVKKFENFELDIEQIYDEFKVLNKPLNEEFVPYNPNTFNVSNYKDRVKNYLHYIISNVEGISEKSFKQVDELTKRIKWIFKLNPEIDEVIRRYADRKCRYEFAAEHIYEWFVKNFDIKNITQMEDD